ncbi:MAG TPA: hydroxysqualene dehydroxylase HpnE, partial [Rhodocyclaceae bacterium]|nr:hydroxysqualene dehydroxylase HpnE [Rhodocyclaceae bacterium]
LSIGAQYAWEFGGGWAGIAAAVTLVAGGRQVTLFEAGRRLGGRARGVELDGQPVDNGQHILLGAYRETLALMRQVGADPARLLERRPLQIVDPGVFRMALPGWLPAPFNLAWGLLRAEGVHLREKVATARWMDGLKRQNYRLGTDCSVAEWLEAGGQNGILARHLWAPLCLAALNTPPERASAQVFCNVLRDSLGSPRRADTDLLLPRGDLSSLLPDPANRWLAEHGGEIRLGRRVKDLIVEDGHVYVDGEPFAAAIIATAPQHAAELTEIGPAFEFEPIATVYLGYANTVTLAYPMQAMSGGVGQWIVDRGNGLLACVLSGHGDWETM